MSTWNQLIIQSLRELNADSIYTRGAILRHRISEVAKANGLDFDAYLKESNLKFSELLGRIDSVDIIKRPNTDMFVGLLGANPPFPTGRGTDPNRQWFREDIYELFTRIRDISGWYLPETDEFTNSVSDEDPRRKIAVPAITLADLLSQRRDFAEQQKGEDRAELTRAIEYSFNPLPAFQTAIANRKLKRSWHDFKSARISEAIRTWARENSIDFNQQWLQSDTSQQNAQSPQQIMAHLASFMTDEEVRSVAIPFRAVEAMYRSVSQSTKATE